MSKMFSNLINVLRKVKLSKRLIFTLVLIFTLTSVFVGFILYRTSKDIVLLKTNQYLTDYILHLQTNIDKYLDNQFKSLNELVTNVGVINAVKIYDPSSPDEQTAGVLKIYNEIFRAKKNMFGFIGLEVSTLSDRIRHLQHRVTTGDINTSPIMQAMAESPERIKIFGTIPLEKSSMYHYILEDGKGIVIGAKIKNHTNGKVIGMAVMAFTESSLYKEIFKGSYGGNDDVYIADQNGVIISRNDKSLLGQEDISSITKTISQLEYKSISDNKSDNFEIKINDSNYLVYYSISKTTGWRIISLTNYDNLISEINKNYIASLIILVILTIIVFLISILVTKSITIPLSSITHAMRKTSIKDNYPEVGIAGNDEMSYLGNTFNQMSRRIKYLIVEIKEINRREKQAEFKALQSQINPHFLYNTLDSVNWMAYLSGNLDICEIVNSLSKFFRLSLNKGKDFYSIADEVEHFKSYINIQKIKYRERITFTINVDTNCLDYKTIKILLQPLVENSIYHGIEPKGGSGEINIRIYQEKFTVKMVVTDNGVGIKKHSAQLVKNQDKVDSAHSGYGMTNIDERIKLYFGKEYGLFIENNEPYGTKVTIKIPVILDKEPPATNV